MDSTEKKSSISPESATEGRAAEGYEIHGIDKTAEAVREEAIKDLADISESNDALNQSKEQIESQTERNALNQEQQSILGEAKAGYEELDQRIGEVLGGGDSDHRIVETETGPAMETVHQAEAVSEEPVESIEKVSSETVEPVAPVVDESADIMAEAGAGPESVAGEAVKSEEADNAENSTEQKEIEDGQRFIEDVLKAFEEEEVSQEEMIQQVMEKFGIPPGASPDDVLSLVARHYEQALGLGVLPDEIKDAFVDNENKVAEKGIEDAAPDPEDCRADEYELEIMHARASEKYASEIGFTGEFTDEQVAAEREKTEKDMSDEIRGMKLSEKEQEFLSLIKKGEDLLSENNPETVKAYLLEVKGQIDNCSKHLKCIYLQMEREMGKDPEKKRALQEDFFSLVSSIEKLDEASRMIDEIMFDLSKIKAGEEISDETKGKLKKLLLALGAVAALLGVIVYIGDKIAKFVGAHQQAAGIAGIGGMGIGAYKLGAFSALGVSAPFAAKIFCFASFLRLAADERKRDRLVEKIFGINLPSWAKAPAKSSK